MKVEEQAARVEDLFAESLPLLQQEAIDTIRHYLEHGEHEMAFEVLALSLITGELYPSGFIGPAWSELAVELGLDKDAVLDAAILEKLDAWIQAGR